MTFKSLNVTLFCFAGGAGSGGQGGSGGYPGGPGNITHNFCEPHIYKIKLKLVDWFTFLIILGTPGRPGSPGTPGNPGSGGQGGKLWFWYISLFLVKNAFLALL